MPETQSQKKDALRLCGADLRLVPAVSYKIPIITCVIQKRLPMSYARNGWRCIWANQFDNIANRQGHVDGTGPEIWAQTEGKIDGFICAVGSGGTLGACPYISKNKIQIFKSVSLTHMAQLFIIIINMVN